MGRGDETMNRIVREHYPVSKLPEDLREAFAGQDEVTVTIEEVVGRPLDSGKARPEHIKSLDELFAMAQPIFSSLEEVTAHVRSLRDEWA
jgi:hypothetical protein